MLKVTKRDGHTVDFDINKIKEAILKAFDSVQKVYDESILDLLSLRVTSDFQSKIVDNKIQVEQIQDSVEKVLSISGYTDVSKSYILYRKQRENVRKINSTAIDYKNIVDAYLNDSNKENDSLSLFSVGGFILSNSATITKNYWLTVVYDQQISNAHENGDIYIHGLDMMTGDSAGWSLLQLIKNGLGGIDKKISCRPAKHLSTICSQLVNFLGIMQNEWAGAQSIPSFDTYLAPFVRKDRLSQSEVNQCIESFVYGVNMPSRWGTQAPFSCVTFDWQVPEDLNDVKCWIGNEEQSYTYGDCQKEMRMIQIAFFTIMNTTDLTGHGFPFPIPTINVKKSFDSDEEETKLLFKSSSKFGTPYFQNEMHFIHHDRIKYDDFNILPHKSSGYFGYGENTGSLGTVTMNLPRLALKSKNEDDFFNRLKSLIDISIRTLNVKRQVLEAFLDEGLYPYTKRYISDFKNYVCSLGIIGMNETCLAASWIQQDLSNDKSQIFSKKVLEYIQEQLVAHQNKYHLFYNLEATPAESVSYYFVQKDKEYFNEYPFIDQEYYTNSTDLPVDFTDDVFEALKCEQSLLEQYTGGSVFHIFVDQQLGNEQDVRRLIEKTLSSTSVPNITLSPYYSVCSKHGYIPGAHTSCPYCHNDVEIWSRVAGYYQPVQNWNRGKAQEFSRRVNFLLK